MTDRDPTQPTDHERKVAAEHPEEADRGEESGATAEVGATPYEEEIEAERRATPAAEIAAEEREDERDPLDSAYQPRSG